MSDLRPMEFFEVVCKRRSVRRFKHNDVEDSKIRKVLEAAIWAPSGSNIQPWRFVVVKDKDLIKKIKMFSPGMFSEPPVLIVVCSDEKEALEKGGSLGRDYLSIVDCAMATQNILLASCAVGLGSCVIKSFDEAAVKKILGLPEHFSPELIVALGYPDEEPKPPKRKPLSEITFLNRYGEPLL